MLATPCHTPQLRHVLCLAAGSPGPAALRAQVALLPLGAAVDHCIHFMP